MEITFVEAICWYLAGAITHIIFSNLLQRGQAVLFLNGLLIQSLKIMRQMASDIALARQAKYDIYARADMPEDFMETMREIDQRVYINWKMATIATFIASFPKNYRGLLKFHDWDGAMKVLDDIYRREEKYHAKDGK
jgi:hypothetical protein